MVTKKIGKNVILSQNHTETNSNDWTITKKTTRTIKHENFAKMKILKVDRWALSLTPGFNGLHKDNCKMRRETIKFWELMRLILEIWRYIISFTSAMLKIRQFAVLKTCEKYCLPQWIWKFPGSFAIHWVRQYLVNIVLFGKKDL